MIELERTYLARETPVELEKCEHKTIIDIYIPRESKHPSLRLRKNGDRYRLTKKEPVNIGNNSEMKEETIVLTEREFNSLNKDIKGKRVKKVRYQYKYKNNTAEIDIFQENLKGLILVDFEFNTTEEKNNFKMPDFCLVEVTQEEFIAGGMLCGKSYKDINDKLEKFEYKKLLY